MVYLKSVDGLAPCHPISFHWSDIKPFRGTLGKAHCHRALSDSCWMLMKFLSTDCINITIQMKFVCWIKYSFLWPGTWIFGMQNKRALLTKSMKHGYFKISAKLYPIRTNTPICSDTYRRSIWIFLINKKKILIRPDTQQWLGAIHRWHVSDTPRIPSIYLMTVHYFRRWIKLSPSLVTPLTLWLFIF